MSTTKRRGELFLIAWAIISALLLVLGHLILSKSFVGYAWTEYTAAAIPFVLFAIFVAAVKYAAGKPD
ncbi:MULTISPECIES: hypothetical protein [Vibrio]|uniref:Uncharacterized protein n=1 Tax=Vibrio proteolyticus NBRC 13287 TaxID=1219065 RepID=U2ZW09_VIBPR|nr:MULTISPECIES: hypothetical protein [Vibrio]NAW57881.1 hypothetical protein [Vibrio sp. V36_P2S2PM302]NAX21996.1 hypothetical protein [Vibrio sp. V39_P1S14PM300]NAX27948.1 hypothetical protein [Vibrio sp. V38_P2S17PM301]NAX28889.1 hypothetical protein [Vibrio sp. V37_P2S8PM304]GAD65630.1 hypothetical protein VPR01S_01_04040 [Vibrio proteolyticus NBRC 13287]